ncbi:MAG: hypothetical protein ACLS48_10535 [[Eubacterium] siraeum]
MVRYEIFAEKAKQNGDEEISQIFRTTAKMKRLTHKMLGLIYGGIRKPPMRLKGNARRKLRVDADV